MAYEVGKDDFTLVVGVDAKTLAQAAVTIPTWRKHKPSLFKRPVIVFFDNTQIEYKRLQAVFNPSDFRFRSLLTVPWPPRAACYVNASDNKWGSAQRAKMLAGFTFLPGEYCDTKYWLKLDTDVMATGQDDWVDPAWFDSGASIIAPPWGYTKPAEQIDVLDAWAQRGIERGELPEMYGTPPLSLHPEPGATKVFHRRICSWCAFFNTEFTRTMAMMAMRTCAIGHCPVPSQDGYASYCATRLNRKVIRQPMKDRGWQLVSHRLLAKFNAP